METISDRFRLDGKIALVSGGAGIVGFPIVRALSEAGATVICASRDGEKCRQVAAHMVQEGRRVVGLACDFADASALRVLRDQILQKHGRLDILINNAVARAGGDLRNATAEEWEESMKLNSTGLFLSCQIFSEPMQAQRSGSIVNIGSIYGMVGPTFSIYEGTPLTNPINYAFSKGGLINLTRYLASWLGPYNVRVNSLSPGGFESAEQGEVFRANYSKHVPLGRMAKGEDIQGPVVFLASDASRYITGVNIPVDGGWTAI